MEPILVAFFAVIFSLIAIVVYKAHKKNKYWEERGIAFPKPLLFLGNSLPLLLRKKQLGELHYDIAKQFPNEPIIRIYNYTKPILLIKDAEIIEQVLIKDFTHFTDRGFPIDRRNAFDISLFTLTGKEWRALRYKLSPLFTTGKLKNMYGPMAECGDALTSLLNTEKTEEVDMKEILGRFAMDVIGSCAFGIDAGNLSKPDNEFRKMGKKASEFSTLQLLKFAFMILFPKFSKWFRLSFTRRDVAEYFCNIIKDTIEYRKKNNVVRNDFLQLLMTLKDKGSIELQTKDPADDYLRIEPTQTVESIEINEDIIIGQAFTFLKAGFEGAAAAVMFALYELANKPEIQDKVRKEILKQVENAGSLTYDAVKQMTYTEQCVKETLRKYPPAPLLGRVCTKNYTLPNGLTMSPGQSIVVSIRSIHNDPHYFPEPEEFRPERFDPDQKVPSCAFLPFGNGPRICIAMRFVMMEINYCLAKLLMSYEFRINPKTKPFQLSKRTFITVPKDPILFDIKKIVI